MKAQATAEASPSLALVKYWGKSDGPPNLPATSNLAIGLDTLRTSTTVVPSQRDAVTLDGADQPLAPFVPLFDAFRKLSGYNGSFTVQSSNNFPTAAGIASSSSGFAALTLALNALLETKLSDEQLSSLARTGSGSASRAVYGGFTRWEAGEPWAQRFLPAAHWPQLRVVVAILSAGKKPVGSRAGMERSKRTSPLYSAWVNHAAELFERGCAAVQARSLEHLGPIMRESYLTMFATMFTARPPFLYWIPESVALLRTLEELRSAGVPAWETMDAGPQVKVLTTAPHVEQICQTITSVVPDAQLIITPVGGAPSVLDGAGSVG